ncbi:hypothetical protein BGW38_008122, partial [Lunasporangiospora selenospora]
VHYQVLNQRRMLGRHHQSASEQDLDSKAGSDSLQPILDISFKSYKSVLQEFGLQLSGHRVELNRNVFFQLPSIDYSLYITKILPESFLETGLPVRRYPIKRYFDPPSTAKETDDEQKDQPNMRTIRRINRLLLHHNHLHITELGFYLHESAYFVSFATVMPKLQILQLSGRRVTSDTHEYYHNIIDFMQQHNKAFPSKQRLDVHLHQTLACLEISRRGSDSDWLMARQQIRANKEPLLKIYEAVGQPCTLNVTSLPWFYRDSHGIGTENLVSLVDEDTNRIFAGEGPDMESFLRRCHRLKKLNLSVGDPNVFRWAVPTTTLIGNRDNSVLTKQETNSIISRIRGGSPRPLPMLTDLVLLRDYNAKFTIHALNDAVEAFGKSLETIKVLAPIIRGRFVPEHEKDLVIQTTRALDVTSERRAGFGWCLPNVRKIHLDLPGAHEIRSFDQCPLLEELNIGGHLNQGKMPVSDSAPFAGHEQKRITSQSPELLPAWNLPQLRTLILSDQYAVRFDFESLRSMQRLKHLELQMSQAGQISHLASLYMSACPQVIMDILKGGGAKALGREYQMNDRGNGGNGEPQCERPLYTFYPWDWESDSLISLKLQGPIAMMFHLQMFPRFPRLQSLYLSSASSDQKILPTMKHAVKELYTTLLPVQIQDAWLTSGESSSVDQLRFNVQDAESLQRTVPQHTSPEFSTLDPASLPTCRFMESQLNELVLEGHWEAIENDVWIQLLTKYAPNLRSLQAPRRQDLTLLFELIERIDRVFQEVEAKGELLDMLKEESTDMRKRPWPLITGGAGLKLLEVIFDEAFPPSELIRLGFYDLSLEERENVGFTNNGSLAYWKTAQQDNGVRVYRSMRWVNCLVKISDKERVVSGSSKHVDELE